MTVENYLAEAGALATLAGVLGGFAISAVIQLLTSSNKDKISTAAIVVFSASSVMFMYSLLVSVLSFAATAELNSVPSELDGINAGALLILFGAIYLFVSGIGLAGWIRSKTTGILTSIFAIVSACLITYAIGSVISLFM